MLTFGFGHIPISPRPHRWYSDAFVVQGSICEELTVSYSSQHIDMGWRSVEKRDSEVPDHTIVKFKPHMQIHTA
jgi:hypothetical protein